MKYSNVLKCDWNQELSYLPVFQVVSNSRINAYYWFNSVIQKCIWEQLFSYKLQRTCPNHCQPHSSSKRGWRDQIHSRVLPVRPTIPCLMWGQIAPQTEGAQCPVQHPQVPHHAVMAVLNTHTCSQPCKVTLLKWNLSISLFFPYSLHLARGSTEFLFSFGEKR